MNYVATTYILAIKPLYPIAIHSMARWVFITILRGFMGYSFAYNFGYPIKYTNPIFRSFFFVSKLNRKRTPPSDPDF